MRATLPHHSVVYEAFAAVAAKLSPDKPILIELFAKPQSAAALARRVHDSATYHTIERVIRFCEKNGAVFTDTGFALMPQGYVAVVDSEGRRLFKPTVLEFRRKDYRTVQRQVTF